MWGGSTTIQALSGGVVNTPVASGQCARVNFGRPDTWSFLFYAQIGSGSGPGGSPVTPNGLLTVHVDLIVGVGRSLVQLPSFVTFVFQWGGGFNANAQGKYKWTAAARGSILDDQASTPDQLVIEHFPAEDIQASARVIMGTVTNGDTAAVTVTTLFAPRSHTRPEWFEIEPRFPGSENMGA